MANINLSTDLLSSVLMGLRHLNADIFFNPNLESTCIHTSVTSISMKRAHL